MPHLGVPTLRFPFFLDILASTLHVCIVNIHRSRECGTCLLAIHTVHGKPSSVSAGHIAPTNSKYRIVC